MSPRGQMLISDLRKGKYECAIHEHGRGEHSVGRYWFTTSDLVSADRDNTDDPETQLLRLLRHLQRIRRTK